MDAQTIVNAVASALRFAEYVPGTGPQVDAKLENAANFYAEIGVAQNTPGTLVQAYDSGGTKLWESAGLAYEDSYALGPDGSFVSAAPRRIAVSSLSSQTWAAGGDPSFTGAVDNQLTALVYDGVNPASRFVTVGGSHFFAAAQAKNTALNAWGQPVSSYSRVTFYKYDASTHKLLPCALVLWDGLGGANDAATWSDATGLGSPTTADLSVSTHNYAGLTPRHVGRDGVLWFQDSSGQVYSLTPSGLDAHGNPAYSWDSLASVWNPGFQCKLAVDEANSLAYTLGDDGTLSTLCSYNAGNGYSYGGSGSLAAWDLGGSLSAPLWHVPLKNYARCVESAPGGWGCVVGEYFDNKIIRYDAHGFAGLESQPPSFGDIRDHDGALSAHPDPGGGVLHAVGAEIGYAANDWHRVALAAPASVTLTAGSGGGAMTTPAVYCGLPRVPNVASVTPVVTVTGLSGMAPKCFGFSLEYTVVTFSDGGTAFLGELVKSNTGGYATRTGATAFDLHWAWQFSQDAGTVVDPRPQYSFGSATVGGSKSLTTDQFAPVAVARFASAGSPTLSLTPGWQDGSGTFAWGTTTTPTFYQPCRWGWSVGGGTGTFKLTVSGGWSGTTGYIKAAATANGPDTGDGSGGNPYQTVRAALQAVAPSGAVVKGYDSYNAVDFVGTPGTYLGADYTVTMDSTGLTGATNPYVLKVQAGASASSLTVAADTRTAYYYNPNATGSTGDGTHANPYTTATQFNNFFANGAPANSKLLGLCGTTVNYPSSIHISGVNNVLVDSYYDVAGSPVQGVSGTPFAVVNTAAPPVYIDQNYWLSSGAHGDTLGLTFQNISITGGTANNAIGFQICAQSNGDSTLPRAWVLDQVIYNCHVTGSLLNNLNAQGGLSGTQPLNFGTGKLFWLNNTFDYGGDGSATYSVGMAEIFLAGNSYVNVGTVAVNLGLPTHSDYPNSSGVALRLWESYGQANGAAVGYAVKFSSDNGAGYALALGPVVVAGCYFQAGGVHFDNYNHVSGDGGFDLVYCNGNVFANLGTYKCTAQNEYIGVFAAHALRLNCVNNTFGPWNPGPFVFVGPLHGNTSTSFPVVSYNRFYRDFSAYGAGCQVQFSACTPGPAGYVTDNVGYCGGAEQPGYGDYQVDNPGSAWAGHVTAKRNTLYEAQSGSPRRFWLNATYATLATWQGYGLDADAVLTNPGWNNPAALDFRLLETLTASPTFLVVGVTTSVTLTLLNGTLPAGAVPTVSGPATLGLGATQLNDTLTFNVTATGTGAVTFGTSPSTTTTAVIAYAPLTGSVAWSPVVLKGESTVTTTAAGGTGGPYTLAVYVNGTLAGSSGSIPETGLSQGSTYPAYAVITDGLQTLTTQVASAAVPLCSGGAVTPPPLSGSAPLGAWQTYAALAGLPVGGTAPDLVAAILERLESSPELCKAFGHTLLTLKFFADVNTAASAAPWLVVTELGERESPESTDPVTGETDYAVTAGYQVSVYGAPKSLVRSLRRQVITLLNDSESHLANSDCVVYYFRDDTPGAPPVDAAGPDLPVLYRADAVFRAVLGRTYP